MFKTQYLTDHLGINSKITESSDEIQYIEQAKEFSQLKRYRRSDVDSESGSRIKRIDVPGDNSCLFWSVTMAYLIPVRNDDALFRQRYAALFGNEEAVTRDLDHIRDLVRNLSTASYDDTFANLVRNVFRNRVVDHISSHRNEFKDFVEGESGLSFKDYLENMRKLNTWGGEPEIRAMGGMLSATISVSGEVETQYGDGNIQIQLFHVGAPGNRNHYNFGLERGTVDNDVELAKGLKKVMGKVNPQDFELIQLLIEEAGKEVGINRQDEDFKSFEPRFQSFVDQIPSYLHSVEKAGFFTHFFLGSFSTLLGTEIAKKLNIKKIYFSFDTSKTLKVAIVKNGQIGNAEDAVNNINLFSISEGKRGHQFTADELKSILRNNIDRSKIKDRDIENKIQDRIKSRLVQIYKGKDGIFVNMEVKEILDSPASKEFHEIEKGIWNNPEADIAELNGSDEAIVERSLEGVLGKISEVHSKYENSLTYDSSAREAAHHGFMVGVFMNFHYRYNLRVYPEQFAGRGYADIILLARGPDRALDSIPIIIELKAGAGTNATPDKALQQAEKYAQGFQPNVQRVLTTADNILCVGVNFDNPSPISDIKVSNREEEIIPLFQEILESTKDLDTQTIGKRELKEQVKDNLERIYHTFPGTPEKGDNHYFSRFLLGQSLLLSEDSGANLKKYIFIYGDNIPTEVHPNLRGFGRLAAQRSREALSTNLDASHAVVTMVLIPENTEKLVYVINIVEANRKDVLNKALPLDRLGREMGGRKIVELGLNFDTRYKSDFKRYLTVWAEKYNSLQEYNNGAERFQGTFKEVPYPNELKETFDQALDAQSSSIDEYNKLLEKIGEGIFPFKSLVNKEAHFQGILNGAFSYYSDLKLQKSQETRALVLTEFQTGRGERIDMLVHGIKFSAQGRNAEEYTPIGLELKASRQGKGAQALLKEANNQINEEYKEGVTYKTLTDGDEVKFIGVVFDKGSNNKNKLILTSRTAKEGFIPVEVVHSSVHMLPTVGQCSKRKSSSPEYPPSKKPRRERSVSMACIDSFDEEKITEEEKEQRIKELFNADKVAERVKNIEFYDQLFKVSQKISEGEIIDKNVEEAFIAKIKDVDLNSIDPEIRDIVKEIKDNIENKEEIKNILRRSGVAEKIGKVAEGAGLAFTVFLVGKHIANGDIEGLGYDALNLWVMPKIGEKISGKILELGTKLDSQMLKGFAPVMGRAIGNFAAFLGLEESIKARQSATDPVDIKIADLNIATNSIFIAADVPAVVTETMSAIGMEAGVIGEFTGPVGFGISVAVIIISQFVEAGLEVEKLTEQMSLTDQEKHDLYWDFFLGKKVPDYIERDIGVENIYKQYMSKILDQFKSEYDTIAISLPSILITKEKYVTNNNSRKKRQGEEITNWLRARDRCITRTRVVNNEFGFDLSTNITHPFHISGTSHYSRIIPGVIKNYNLVCGPLDDNVVKVTEELLSGSIWDVSSGWSCGNSSPHNNEVLSKTREEWSLQKYMTDCYNAALYNKSNSSGLAKMLFYMSNDDAFISVASNYTIDVLFNGKNILLNSYGIDNQGSSAQNRYYFTNQLSNCDVHKQGTNFFYIAKDNFVCNLGGSSIGQNNIVVTRGNFTDSENIHSIIGSDKANHIEVSHASYVDGKGGNDVITAKSFTTIKGYFGDSIYGKGLVLLPINFNDIGNITYANNITNIYSKSGDCISVDKQTLVKTGDGLFVTPTKVDTNTGTVTSLQVTKSVDSDVILDDELDNLRKIDNSNFNITKQLSSTNYHSTIGSSSNHIFYPDKEHHNFYWEAPSNISHLYLFDNRNANITIAQANGILDFSQLNCTLNDIPFIENDKGEIKINKNGLNVTLLPDHQDVTVTFDGQEYYKFQNGELERDYCSHSLKIDGRFSVNGTDLLNHHNCFTFDSDKVLFLKLNNDLLLLSGRGALSISDYYPSVHKNWDLSIGLNNRVMEPEEFGERADDFSSFRYYQPDEQGLQIYHNQPINKNDIGLVDLKDKSILDFDMKVMNDTLLLSHKNNTLVKVENWNTYQPAREMMFGFNDAIVSNSKCIASTCNPENIIEEFHKEKGFLLEPELFNTVEQNNLDKVKELVNQGANINATDMYGKTPLDLATQKGYEDIVRILKQTQLDLDKELLINAQDGDLNKVKDLIARGASLEAKDDNGSTPLYYAAWNGQLGVVIYLVENGASLKVKNHYNKAPLYDAFSNCYLDIVEYLTEKDTGINAVDYVNAIDQDGWTPLHWAASKGCLEVAKFLIEKGADINAQNVYGREPIHIAAEHDNKNIIEFLLNKGVSVNEADKDGWTPLYWASWNGNLDVAKYLIDKGASINAKDKNGKTPLDIAIDKKHVNVEQYLRQVQLDKKLLFAVGSRELNEIKNLISQGANLEVKDGDGSTPLHIASKNNYLDGLEYLVKSGANLEAKNSYGRTPLFSASFNGNLDVIKYLVKNGANLETKDYNGRTPLCFASAHSRLDVVKWFVENGANLEAKDYNGETSLYLASVYGRLDVVKYLISKGADIDADNGGKTSLDIARHKGHSDIVACLQQTQLDKQLLTAVQSDDLNEVKDLIARGASLEAKDKNGSTPLHYAAWNGQLGVVMYLVENGANLEAKNHYGRTALHDASLNNHLDIVEYLVKKGVGINTTDKNGWTSLHWAASKGYLEVAKFLIEKGASINAQEEGIYGRKPIHVAAGDNNKNIIELLLSRGVSVDDTERVGNTPLYYAAWRGRLEAAEFLVDRGANINAADNSGKKPVHVAAENNNKNIIEFLLSKGVSVDEADKDGWTPLHWAALKDRLEVAKFLVDKGANINAEDVYGKKPIHRAATVGYRNIIEFLLSKGVSIDEIDNGWTRTPLHWASDGGYLDVVRYLISNGANINAKDKDGKTPIDIARGAEHTDIVQYLEERSRDYARGKKAMHFAAENNNMENLRFLISKGENVNDCGDDYWRPLHYAAKAGSLEAAKFLVENGAGFYSKKYETTDGQAPIHIAAYYGHENIVKFFVVEKGVDVNWEDGYRSHGNWWTPLHWASKGGHLVVVEHLVSLGDNIDAKDKDSKTPIDIARGEGHTNIVQYLEERSKDYARGKKAMHFAAENNDMENLRFLISKGENVNDCGDDYWRPLHYAAKAGSLEAAKFLVENGAGFYSKKYETTDGQAPIHIAAYYGHENIVKFFVVEKGVDVNWEDGYRSHGNWWTPLHWASKGGHLVVVEHLVSLGDNIDAKDKDSKTPIDIARGEGHTNIVQYLEERSKDYARGKKAMHFAAENNDMENLRFLVSKGENVNDCGDDYWRPLHYAAKAGSLEAARFLVENGAGFYSRKYETTDGQAPIHIAAYYGHKNIVEFFVVEKGVDVNWQDGYRSHGNWWTPLHWASKGGRLDVVEYLVSLGANINAQDWYRKTPLDIAIGQKHDNVVGYLKKIKEEREKPVQRNRRHLLSQSLDSSGQPEVAASSGTRPSSLFGSVKNFIGELFYSKAELPAGTSNTTNSISQIDVPIDVNGTIMLLDMLVRKVTGQKYISTADQSIFPLEAQDYALNITKGFEKVVEQAGLKSGVSMHRLNIDFVEIQKEVTGKIMSGKFDEISGILKLYIEKACPSREAGCPGKLSSKKFDKFMVEFNSGLNIVLNQSIQQILHNGDGRLEVDGAKQMNLEPQSYLSNASVQGHSKNKVSTCLSEIGVTKLGGNLNR